MTGHTTSETRDTHYRLDLQGTTFLLFFLYHGSSTAAALRARSGRPGSGKKTGVQACNWPGQLCEPNMRRIALM